MKYLLILIIFSCKSTSIHEHNLTQQYKTMLKYDKQSRKVQQKIRSEKQVKIFIKRKKVKANVKKYI